MKKQCRPLGRHCFFRLMLSARYRTGRCGAGRCRPLPDARPLSASYRRPAGPAPVLRQLMIPQLLANIGKALVVVACMSRGISIIIYGVFLPIPIADVYKDGLNSKGIRYIKKLIALFIQGAIILLVVMASSLLQGSVQQAVNGVASTILGMFYNIGLIFVTVMVIFKSQNIANDIVGA